MIHDVVLALTLVLMGGVTASFLYVASHARKEGSEYEVVQRRSYALRTKFFWLLVIAGVAIGFVTTGSLPYSDTHDTSSVNSEIQINVIGKQWSWELSKTQINAGDTVVFTVSSSDVNHGLGIYDANLKLLAQTQAMPGYTNKLRFTFDTPGEYKLLCMEYCGVAHHAMVSSFVVTQKN